MEVATHIIPVPLAVSPARQLSNTILVRYFYSAFDRVPAGSVDSEKACYDPMYTSTVHPGTYLSPSLTSVPIRVLVKLDLGCTEPGLLFVDPAILGHIIVAAYFSYLVIVDTLLLPLTITRLHLHCRH